MESKKVKPLLLASSVSLALCPTVALSQQSAHVHGIAELLLAIDGNELQIEFISPADNIVGFEHEPETSQEKASVKAALKWLGDAGNAFTLSSQAGCEVEHADVDLHGMKGDHEDHGHDDHGHDDHGHDEHGHDDHGHDDHGHDDHGHDDHGHDDHGHDDHGGEHSEFHAEYHFECAAIDALQSLRVELFEKYPAIEEIHFKAITDRGQSGGDLTAQNPVIPLK